MGLLSADSLVARRPATEGALAVWEAGFRPFFLLAGLAAAALMAIWALVYAGVAMPPLAGLVPALWHGHEMVFGFAMAVIAGFLLTAARNWTSRPTASPGELRFMVVAWALARSVPLATGAAGLWPMAAADLVFIVMVMVTVARPIVQVRQWRQLPVLGVLSALAVANTAFFFFAAQGNVASARTALLLGTYGVLLMVHVIGARVIPFFVERGTSAAAPVHEPTALKVLVPASFVLYALMDVGFLGEWGWTKHAMGAAAVLLAVLSAWRLACWSQRAAFQQPMLAILLLGYMSFPIGAALRALSVWASIPSTLAFHAMVLGGVGAMTLGMMVRVTLGHTGRNIFEPPSGTTGAFGLLAAAFSFRVLAPLVLPGRYTDWVLVAQLAWIAAFLIFVLRLGAMLVRPRADGRPG